MENQKEIMVVDKIVSIDRKKKLITFSLQFPSYFSKEHQEWVNNVLLKLQNQVLGGDIKITGLSLKFNEED